MPVWGVVGGTVVAESRPASGRYTLRTTEEAPRPWRVPPVREPRNDGGPPVVTSGPGTVRAPQGRGCLRIFFLFC